MNNFIDEIGKAMAEASKSHPVRRLVFAVLLFVGSVVVFIASGPSGDFLKQNPDWLSWAPGYENWKEKVNEVGNLMNLAAISLFGWAGKLAWEACKAFMAPPSEKNDLSERGGSGEAEHKQPNPLGEVVGPEGGENLAEKVKILEDNNRQLVTKIGEWNGYADYLAKKLDELTIAAGEEKIANARTRRILDWLSDQLLWRRLLLRSLILMVCFAMASMAASRLFPLEVAKDVHGYALFVAFVLVGAIGSGLLLGDKLSRASTAQLVTSISIAAFVCNLCYALMSYGYERMFSDIESGADGIDVKLLSDAILAALWRLLACPAGAALGAWLLISGAGRRPRFGNVDLSNEVPQEIFDKNA